MSADQSELIMQYETDLANKDRRIAELEGALRPFAGYRGSDQFIASKDTPDGALCASVSFTAGEYRAARSALNSQQVSK